MPAALPTTPTPNPTQAPTPNPSATNDHGPGIEAVAAAMTPMLTNLAVGVVAGAIAVVIVGLVRRVWPGKAHA